MKIVTGILLLAFLFSTYSEEIQCSLGFDKPYVQDKDASFLFFANITGINSVRSCGIKFLVEEMISKQIIQENSKVLANFHSNIDRIPRKIPCSLNDSILDCSFSCKNNAKEQNITIIVPAKMNPIYQRKTKFACTLYYSNVAYNDGEDLAPPQPKIINTTGTYVNGSLGGNNTLNIFIVTDFEIPPNSTISIIDLPILDQNINLQLRNEGNITALDSGKIIRTTNEMISIYDIQFSNDPKVQFCIMNITMQSSFNSWKYPYSIRIKDSDHHLIAQTDNNTFWSPSNPALLTNRSIFPSSHLVGESPVRYVFQFEPPFTINTSFEIKFKLIKGQCIQIENTIIASFLNITQNCNLKNCECSFAWNPSMSPPLHKGKLYNFFWENFSNPISSSMLKFEVTIMYQSNSPENSNSMIMANGDFDLDCFYIVDSIGNQDLSFDNSKIKENKISRIADYIITFTPKIPLPINLIISIEMNTNLSIIDPPCNPNISNCLFNSTHKRELKDIIDPAKINSKYTTHSFKMQNPDCGGFLPINFITTFSSFECDNASIRLNAVRDTSTSVLLYYGLPCEPSPSISNISNPEQGASSTYEFDYTGCQNSFPLTHIQVEFPPTFTLGNIDCYCNSKSNSTKCDIIYNNNTIKVNTYNYCSGKIGINSIINPKLSGPTSPIILRGLVESCEKVYNEIKGPEILIANSQMPKGSQKLTDSSL